MKTWKIGFALEVEPAENGYIVKWKLEGKPKEGESSPDYEHHTLIEHDGQRVLDVLTFATSEARKVLDYKLTEEDYMRQDVELLREPKSQGSAKVK